MGGFAPHNPPTRSLAGAPSSPLRSRGPPAAARSLNWTGGSAPRTPPPRPLTGAPSSPLRSRGSLAHAPSLTLTGASPPITPLHARSRGPHPPRSAPVAHSLTLLR